MVKDLKSRIVMCLCVMVYWTFINCNLFNTLLWVLLTSKTTIIKSKTMHIYRSLHLPAFPQSQQYQSIRARLTVYHRLFLDMLTFCCICQQNHDQGFQFVFRWVHRLTVSLFTVTDIRCFESNTLPENRQIMIKVNNQKGTSEWISNISI